MSISPFLSVNQSCDEAVQWSKEQLTQAGLRPIQTFDLHTARTGSHDCSCPNHGTDECTCQMVVLLVYGDAMEPVTLIMHGNDGCTWFSIAEAVNRKTDKALARDIRRALDFDAHSSTEQM